MEHELHKADVILLNFLRGQKYDEHKNPGLARIRQNLEARLLENVKEIAMSLPFYTSGEFRWGQDLNEELEFYQGFLELYQMLGIDDDEFKEKAREAFKSEYEKQVADIKQDRTRDNLDDARKKADMGKSLVKEQMLDKEIIDDAFVKELGEERLRSRLLYDVQNKFFANYRKYDCKEGRIIESNPQEFLKDACAKVQENLGALANKLGVGQEKADEILNQIRLKEMNLSNRRDLREMFYEKFVEYDEELKRELEEARQGYAAIAKLGCKSVDLKKDEIERICRKAEALEQICGKINEAGVILDINPKWSGAKYVLAQKDNKLIVVAATGAEYHWNVGARAGVDKIIGGGFMSYSIEDGVLSAVKISEESKEYGKEPRDLALKILQRAMPWCKVKIGEN